MLPRVIEHDTLALLPRGKCVRSRHVERACAVATESEQSPRGKWAVATWKVREQSPRGRAQMTDCISTAREGLRRTILLATWPSRRRIRHNNNSTTTHNNRATCHVAHSSPHRIEHPAGTTRPRWHVSRAFVEPPTTTAVNEHHHLPPSSPSPPFRRALARARRGGLVSAYNVGVGAIRASAQRKWSRPLRREPSPAQAAPAQNYGWLDLDNESSRRREPSPALAPARVQ